MRKTPFAALAAVTLFAVGLTVQIAARALRDAQPGMALTYSIAYRNSPWFGPAFLSEQSAMNAALHYDDASRRWLGDFHGQYFTIANGWRAVTDTPRAWQHTIWLFGNSTLRDTQVPDAYTKASVLQRLFNAEGYSYRVLNRSDNGALVAAELAWLQTAPIQPGDIVVFYGSANEPSLVAMQQTTLEARAVARTHGAAFYDFVPPNIWTRPLTDDEQNLTANTLLVPPGAEAGTRMDAVRAAHRGVGGMDLSHVLDDAHNVYVDHVHTNERGNELIARALFDWLTIY